jgi:opacity protein-like surface antigen
MTVAAMALVGALSAPAAAQDLNQTNIGAAVTFLAEEGEETGAGFLVDVARDLTPAVAVVGEFGLNSFEFSTITSYQGGVRFTPVLEGTAVSPFVQALVGLERFSGDGFDATNGLSFQIGGGVEFPLSDRLNLRAQYDYRRTSYDGEGFNGNRFGVGVVFPLGN